MGAEHPVLCAGSKGAMPGSLALALMVINCGLPDSSSEAFLPTIL